MAAEAMASRRGRLRARLAPGLAALRGWFGFGTRRGVVNSTVAVALLCALLSLAALALWVPVFGTAYAGARGAFMLLLIECVIGGASWQLAQRFAAAGQTGTVVVRQIFALLPLLALLPWIGRHHDPVLELAGATLLSSLLRLALTLGFLRHRAGLRLATLLPRLDDYHSMIDHIRQLCLSRIRRLMKSMRAPAPYPMPK